MADVTPAVQETMTVGGWRFVWPAPLAIRCGPCGAFVFSQHPFTPPVMWTPHHADGIPSPTAVPCPRCGHHAYGQVEIERDADG